RDPVYGAQDHQLRVTLLRALAPEEITQDWNVPQAGNLVPNIGDAIVDQTGNHKTLSIPQLEFSLRLARAQGGHGKAGNRKRVCEIQRADFRGDRKVNVAVRHDHRGELELNAKLF